MSAYDTLILGETGLLRYYPLNDAVGSTTAVDLMSSQNGTVSGTVTFGAASLLGPDAETAATFGGGSISIPTTGLPTGSSPWSLEIWFQSTNAGANYALLSMGAASNGQTGGINQLSSGFGVFTWGGAGHDIGPYGSSNTIDHFHVVGTFDGTKLTVYVNGVAVGSGTPSLPNLVEAGAFIGATPNNAAITTGILQKAAIYNVALTSAQVSSHYSAGAPTSSVALSNSYIEAATIPAGVPAALTNSYIEAATAPTVVPAALSNSYIEAATVATVTPAALSVAYIEVLTQTSPPSFEGWGVSV